MSELPPLDVAEFAAFFRAVHRRDPFPWQTRLAQQVATNGWPGALDLPTGVGKTAALDVAVFAIALDAGQSSRAAPVRIVYVVDRRTIVDQAYERAETIRRALLNADVDIVHRIRARLASYTGDGPSLRTALLRGGIAHDDAWARTPSQPLIAVSTVDQVGSRLLFRGYGVSDAMKPVHAGLLGSDVLYLLDEVHLSQPFKETLAAIRDRYRWWADQPLPGAFVLVEMSATLGVDAVGAFRLDHLDRENALLSSRLRASKPVSLSSTSAKGFTKEVEKHVQSMLDHPGATIAVVVNRVKSARDLHRRLSETVVTPATRIHLLTGRMRPFDRDTLERDLLDRIRAGRTRSSDDSPVVVVATQSIEAGADFDFDGLVTECASLDALRQRFGRLDRLGSLGDSARGAIVARTDSLKDDPVYGDAIGKTWGWLRQHAESDVIDFGTEALLVPRDAGQQGLLAPKAHAPVLLPSHLDAWIQTAPIPEPDPDVALWLHGPHSGPADVQIVWRADLTSELLALAADGDNARAAEEVALNMVETLPPVAAEAMSVPFLAAKRWLEGRTEPDSSDVEGAVEVDDVDAGIEAFLPTRPAILWQGEQSRVIQPDELRPGQTIIVPSSYGGIENGNWDPAADTPVRDVAELAAFPYRRQPVMRLHEAVLRALFDRSEGEEVDVPRPASPDTETPSDRAAVRDWLDRQDAMAGHQALQELLDHLRADQKSISIERLQASVGDGAEEYFVVSGKRRPVVRAEDEGIGGSESAEGATSSFTGIEVTLADHQAGVACIASELAESVGLSAALVADLRLAGEWHDVGKVDPRFQRWLHGGSEFKALVHSAPLAKSAGPRSSRAARRRARERAGYPAGARHELTSVALMASASKHLMEQANDWALVQTLVATHHGCCRPLAQWVPDPRPVDVSFSRDGCTCSASSAHELARLDSGIAERFWQMTRKYGWWGLAYLEAIFRLADHRQSEREMSGAKRDA